MENGKRATYFVRVYGGAIDVVRPLHPSGLVTIGRHDADIEIDDPSLSPRHAVLHVGNRFALEDRDSDAGTSLRGRKLRPGARAELAVGEVAELGNLKLTIISREGGASTGAMAVKPPARPARPEVARADPARAEPTRSAPRSAPAWISNDPGMRDLHRVIERVAGATLGVLILGETGTGKQHLAELVHARSRRAERPFVRLSCAALSEDLLELELFGNARPGTPTRPGVLESASGGTVFLDDVAELPPGIQAKLLRAVDERQVVRVGGLEARPLDVRLVAATERDLEAEVRRGRFRPDLYYRLTGVTLRVPPLRQRPADLEGLACLFLAASCKEAGIARAPQLSPEAWQLLERHDWPGNVRELRNVVERAVLLCTGDSITPAELPGELRDGAAPLPDASDERHGLRVVYSDGGLSPIYGGERDRIIAALAKCAGNQTQAAKLLGISRGTLVSRLESYALPRPRKPRARAVGSRIN
jgi:DNA-binding NtrC family response regulator